MAERNERHHGRKRGILEAVRINDKTAFSRRLDKVAGIKQPDMTELTNLIRTYAPHDGVFELRIPGLHASRASRTNEECVHALRLPACPSSPKE